MAKKFKAEMDRGDYKEIAIRTPDSELRINVDNDDVDSATSIPLIERMLAILNDHWDDAAYAHLKPIERDDNDDGGERRYEKAQERLAALLAD